MGIPNAKARGGQNATYGGSLQAQLVGRDNFRAKGSMVKALMGSIESIRSIET